MVCNKVAVCLVWGKNCICAFVCMCMFVRMYVCVCVFVCVYVVHVIFKFLWFNCDLHSRRDSRRAPHSTIAWTDRVLQRPDALTEVLQHDKSSVGTRLVCVHEFPCYYCVLPSERRLHKHTHQDIASVPPAHIKFCQNTATSSCWCKSVVFSCRSIALMIGYSKLQQGTGTGPAGSIKFRFHNMRRTFDKTVRILCLMWFQSYLHCHLTKPTQSSPSENRCSLQEGILYKTKTPLHYLRVFYLKKISYFLNTPFPHVCNLDQVDPQSSES